jgi:hypothetical protein
LIDQLGRKSFPLYTESSTGEDGSDQTEGFNVDTIEYAVRDLIFAGNVDEFWVLGENTQPPFDQLTVQERQLIKWKYVDGKKSSDIAAKITEHPNTVREHISKVKIKLKDILLSDGMQEFLLLTNIEGK